jgi:serine/threonine protein kinase
MGDSSNAKKIESGAPAAMGKYAPFARLGNGGMADVFLALAHGPVGFKKLAVVKRLRNARDDSHVQMFLDEARLSARLSHPNIVNTYEVGESNGNFYIAMEYLEGQSLQGLLGAVIAGTAVLGDTLVAYVASQALKALHYAHELCDFDGTPLGVVHRDVSPHNIFVTYGGEVKLLDFGIAKANVNTTQTETGVLKGKVRYMAPEQISEKDVDRRIDIFAFGIVLWEMLARRPLHEGDSFSVLTRIATEDAPSVRSVRPEIAPELDAIVARALKRDRAERYQTAEEMRVDLEQYLRGKQDEASDDALARLMTASFAEMRSKVQARVKSFLAMRPSIENDAVMPTEMSQTADNLPVLLAEGSGPRRASSTTHAALPVAHPTAAPDPPAPQKKKPWALIAAGVVALAVVGGILATRAKDASATKIEAHDPAPPVSAAAPIAPAAAQLRLVTTPPGALIEWNGKPVDRTPAELSIEPGAQTITLSLAGYETETLKLDVTPGGTIDRELALRAKAAAAPPAPVHVAAVAHGRAPAARATATASVTIAAPTAKPKIRVLE